MISSGKQENMCLTLWQQARDQRVAHDSLFIIGDENLRTHGPYQVFCGFKLVLRQQPIGDLLSPYGQWPPLLISEGAVM